MRVVKSICQTVALFKKMAISAQIYHRHAAIFLKWAAIVACVLISAAHLSLQVFENCSIYSKIENFQSTDYVTILHFSHEGTKSF